MRTLVPPASALALALALAPPAARAVVPTSYLDVHLVTSFSSGSVERGFLFRASASGSTFAGRPPKGPKWATRAALTGGGSGKDYSSYPVHRLMLPPDGDAHLCNEATGAADYANPAGNAASAVLDPDTGLSGYEGNYVLVPRGECTFEAKARSAQRLGAAGIVVRNTLDSRYGLKDEDEEGGDVTVWPTERRDYECGTNEAADDMGWRAAVDAAALDFAPAPYDASVNDALLSGSAEDGSLCASNPAGPLVANFALHCPSGRCLLTGENATDDGSKLEACCAWDLHLTMGADGPDDGDAVPEDEEERVTIPALFVTMGEGDELYDAVVQAAAQAGEEVRFVAVVPYQRWYPSAHYSGAVLLALAIFTLWIAARETAKAYRASWKKISAAVATGVLVFRSASANGGNAVGRRRRAETEDTVDSAEERVDDLELALGAETADGTAAAGDPDGRNDAEEVVAGPDAGGFTISDDDDDDDAGDLAGTDASHGPGASSFAPVPSEEGARVPGAGARPRRRERADVQRATTTALWFVVAASFLSILFRFDFNKVVRVLYGMGGSLAMNRILFRPMYDRALSSKFVPEGVSAKFGTNAFGNLPGCRGEYFTWIEVLSAVTSFALGIGWIVVGLDLARPMDDWYYWFLQDVMGVCLCVLVLGAIQIDTVMVAGILLGFVFWYNIFYALIGPLLVRRGTSVADPLFCEKYPADGACRGALAPLPTLLAIPWFNDFRGGFSALGLGDIIFPGLLISFAARYDAAMALVGKCTRLSNRSVETPAIDEVDTAGQVYDESGANESSPKRHWHQLGRIQRHLFHGYFGPLMIAYSVGLMTAYMVAWSTKRGQPVLLYLIPTCLGTIFFLGWRRRELSELWSGPKVMRKANRMVGLADKIPESPQTPLPTSSVMV